MAAQRRHPDLFAQNRARQRGDQQWITSKNRMCLNQAEVDKPEDHDANFACQKKASEDLQKGLGRRGSCANGSRLTPRDRNDEGGKKPIADRDNHQHIIFGRQMRADPVLQRKHKRGRDHQRNAKAWVLGRHSLAPRVMWRLRPNPCTRSMLNPASASLRRTNPAAV